MFYIYHRLGGVLTLPDPRRMPNPGDKLVALKRFYTPAAVYREGDVFELIRRTDRAPFGIKCSLANLEVKCRYFTSTWSNIEYSLNMGILGFLDEQPQSTPAETTPELSD